MIPSIQTAASESTEETIKRAMKLLIEGIEIVGGFMRKNYKKQAKLLIDYKDSYDLVYVTHLSPQWYLGSINDLERKFAFKSLSKFVEFSNKIEAEVLTVHVLPYQSGVYSDKIKRKVIENFREDVLKALEIVNEDLILSLENVPQYDKSVAVKALPPSVVGNYIKELRENGYKNIGITFDFEHIASHFYNPVMFAELYGEYVTMVHVSDNDGTSLHQHLPPGKGILPIKEGLRVLKEKGYDFLCSLEGCSGDLVYEFYKRFMEILKEIE